MILRSRDRRVSGDGLDEDVARRPWDVGKPVGQFGRGPPVGDGLRHRPRPARSTAARGQGLLRWEGRAR